jgi:predicted O-methyltransferase YrrM
MVGPARQSLKQLVKRAQEPGWKPFDLVIIDADREGMMDYFDILCRENSGLVKDNAAICVDTTPFKGQMSIPYVKYGKPDSWLINSGQTEIDELRKFALLSDDYDCKEEGCLMEVRKKGKCFDCTSGKNPLASFPNDHIARDMSRWAEKQVMGPLDELRKAVNNQDWSALFGEGLTKLLASPSWSAGPERCEKLRRLCQSATVKRVLEVGSFCGVASMAMAEALPDHGQVVSLEIDPFLANFGDDIKNKSNAWQKVNRIVGRAQDSLKVLTKQSSDPTVNWAPFDLAVIDADKANVMEYFDLIWQTPGFLAQDGTVIVDTTPFKGQFFAKFVKGKLDDWIVSSGQESIEAFLSSARSLSNATVTEEAGLTIIRRRA